MNRPPQVRLYGIDEDELIVDSFAGGGGASLGIQWALGRSPDVAINHDREAIEMHKANHPDTQHHIENVWKVDPRKATKGKRVGLMWLSPDCKHFSKAKGAKPHRSKKIRALAWIAVYWAKALPKTRRPRVIVLENVEEFADWGPLLEDGTPCPLRKGLTFRRFVRQLQNLGYDVDFRELVAADYGAPTTRKRLFLIARCDGLQIQWPDQSHDEHGRGGLPKWRPASDCIEWSLQCPSIFSRKKALAENTQRRIARGIKKFVMGGDPFIVPVAHAGDSRVHSIAEPMRTITGAHRGEHALVAPTLVGIDNKSSGASSAWDAKRPLTTVVLENRHALVGAFLKPRYGEREGQDPRARSMKDPYPTVVPTGNGGDLVMTFLAKHNGGHEATGQRLDEPMHTVVGQDQKALVASSLVKLKGTCKDGQPVTKPLATVQAQGNHYAEVRAFLMKYHRDGGQLGRLQEPMPTVLANDSLALVTVKGEPHVIVDIGMRMLQPRELFRAHGFPETYQIDRGASGTFLTKGVQVRMVGNSVPPLMAQAIVQANFCFVAERREAA